MNLAAENLFPLYAQPFPDEDLTAAEARDVLLILAHVSGALTRSANSLPGIRRRLDAIAGSLIAFMDAIDGDCEDEGAQCDDEGALDDNGLADADGAREQGYACG